MFAEVGFVKPGIDKRLYTYEIPDNYVNDCSLGSAVFVNFADKNLLGWVMHISEQSDLKNTKIKSIIKIDNNMCLTSNGILLITWMVAKYHCGWGNAIRCFLPPRMHSSVATVFKEKKKLTSISLQVSPDEVQRSLERTRSKAQIAILKKIIDFGGDLPLDELKNVVDPYMVHVNALIRKKLITKNFEAESRGPRLLEWREKQIIAGLNVEQHAVLSEILNCIPAASKPYLLFGVTGSGKTEIFLQLIQDCLRQNKQALLLVPEIALTTQSVGRIFARFKSGIAVLHSGMTLTERVDQWEAIKNGRANIIVGARSAIFAPFDNLGLIIVDEEHESSYRQENNPQYRVSEIAEQAKIIYDARLIFASATPSYASLYNVDRGRYSLLRIKTRFDGSMPPIPQIIDMRNEIKQGNVSIFSNELSDSLQYCLDNRQQALIFVARRGFADFLLCRSCGHIIRCDNCDVSMTLHQVPVPKLSCHYCNNSLPIPQHCPKCKSPYIRAFGVGTQRVFDELGKRFANARIVRMDSDTTRDKGAYEKILHGFADGNADILVGTQMIIKGHDFPNVTLAAVVNADNLLHFPDYRSGERALQQLTQLAGRAGRGELKGKVLIQTYCPDHVALRALIQNDYNYAYIQEIKKRKFLRYPPLNQMVKVVFSSIKEEVVSRLARDMVSAVGIEISRVYNGTNTVLHGPAPSPISKMNKYYRWQFFIKIGETIDLQEVLHIVESKYKVIIGNNHNYKNADMTWEINPESFL